MSEEVSADAGAFSVGFAPGLEIAGYRLDGEIGRGSAAMVYRARDARPGRLVALKVLAPELADDEAFRQWFVSELRAVTTIRNPHIMPIFEAGQADGLLYLAMRYVPGGDARSLARREWPLPPARVAAIVWQTASALDAMHAAGLLHRDVKPANMLVDVAPGRRDWVYLSDFALRKETAHPAGPSWARPPVSTLACVAPELIEGGPVDGRADEYALAASAYELLTGWPPFPADDAAALMHAHLTQPPPALTPRRPELPPATDDAVARALAKAPEQRYSSCREFAAALAGALGLRPPPPALVRAAGPVSGPPPQHIYLATPPAAGTRAEQPAPRAEEPAPRAQEPAPRAQEPAPPAEEQVPRAQEQAPSAQGPASTAHEPAPPAEEQASTAHEPAPLTEEQEPRAEEQAPRAEEQAPSAQGPASTAHEPAPRAEERAQWADQPAPQTLAPAPSRTLAASAEPWLVHREPSHLRRAAIGIAVIAALAAASVAVIATGVLRSPAPKPPPPPKLASFPITARSGLPPQSGDVWVMYQGGGAGQAQLYGEIKGAARGYVARLYAQPFPFTARPAVVSSAVLHPERKLARYGFEVTPALATRYYVSVFQYRKARRPLASSPATTVYVATSMTRGTLQSCTRPTCHETFTLSVLVPPPALGAEIGKRWYAYFGLNLSKSAKPPPGPAVLRLGAGGARVGAPRRVSADEYAVTVTFRFPIGKKHGYTWFWAACVQGSEAADGVGLPGGHGCGAQAIPAVHSYLG